MRRDWLYFDDDTMASVRRIAVARNTGKENLPSTRVYGGPGRTPYENDVRGVLAEWTWQVLTGDRMNTDRLMSGDGGVDFIAPNGGTVDVKSAPYGHGHLIFNSFDEFRTDYVVVVISQPEQRRARFDCWITRERFVAVAQPHDFGYGPRQAVLLEDIRRMNQMEHA